RCTRIHELVRVEVQFGEIVAGVAVLSLERLHPPEITTMAVAGRRNIDLKVVLRPGRHRMDVEETALWGARGIGRAMPVAMADRLACRSVGVPARAAAEEVRPVEDTITLFGLWDEMLDLHGRGVESRAAIGAQAALVAKKRQADRSLTPRF